MLPPHREPTTTTTAGWKRRYFENPDRALSRGGGGRHNNGFHRPVCQPAIPGGETLQSRARQPALPRTAGNAQRTGEVRWARYVPGAAGGDQATQPHLLTTGFPALETLLVAPITLGLAFLTHEGIFLKLLISSDAWEEFFVHSILAWHNTGKIHNSVNHSSYKQRNLLRTREQHVHVFAMHKRIFFLNGNNAIYSE